MQWIIQSKTCYRINKLPRLKLVANACSSQHIPHTSNLFPYFCFMSLINKPAILKYPIVLSIPHAGTQFPENIQEQFKKELLPPDDTDWYVGWLYDFAASMGIATISAIYSRWVIDLNRDPAGKNLYNDGRLITTLCPVTDFTGTKIYNDERDEVNYMEAFWRKEIYFYPYHNALQVLLDEVKQSFGGVLLWDCHSVRRHVPAIFPDPLPDLILGSADNTSAAQHITDKAFALLSETPYSLHHNHPFKGGHITRYFGKPDEHQHALQLEMSKQIYMQDDERAYKPESAKEVSNMLQQTLTAMGEYLLELYPKKENEVLLL